MKKFIVEASNDVDIPRYLKASDRLKVTKANGSCTYIAPSNLGSWPTADEFGFDENQYKAFKAAVTKEFSIIQGPPGTGKTFLGLKVASTLLENSNLWNETGGPITVVCYTNHALDQFLEGILKYMESEEGRPDLVRIGGRCKSTALSPYTLYEARRRQSMFRSYEDRNSEISAKYRIDSLQYGRLALLEEMRGFQNLEGIIKFSSLQAWESLEDAFPDVLWTYFQNPAWFGIDDKAVLEGKTASDIFKICNISEQPTQLSHVKQEKIYLKPSTFNDVEINEEDEDECDLDEVLENRVVDFEDEELKRGFFVAKTCEYSEVFEELTYLQGFSVDHCASLLWALSNEIKASESEGARFFAPEVSVLQRWFGEDYDLEPETAQTAIRNRKMLLEEIFRLYKENSLDLPDIVDLLTDIDDFTNLNALRLDERWALYFAVVEQAKSLTHDLIYEKEWMLRDAEEELKNILNWRDASILQSCKVVGLTTTGAAKYNNLLRMMRSKIVIVEEAAEVFEAHIVTCISKHCEQLILIGDHQQLRPNPTVYELARTYNLDLSLFERMLNNKMHCHQLKIQHRMQPDIFDLVTGTIYEELLNHPKVHEYPDVKGITKNVFFITHKEKETSDTDSASKSNMHEAKFIAALSRHLILQGYKALQITVLTMYTGQMSLLRKTVYAHEACKGIRVTCVDNFQGEENDIILLSLVRSNDEGKIGFLNIDNRICVSLSRAKHGLYIIGNINVMENKSETWKAIKDKLEKKGLIGNSLELQCQIHQTKSNVQTGGHFLKHSPEGGCLEMCEFTFSCSHACTRACHIVDKDHVDLKCQAPCPQLCANKLHPCRGKCSETCPNCYIYVERVMRCDYQHIRKIPCFRKIEEVECDEQLEKTLPCGHVETLPCHIKIEDYECTLKVLRKFSCGHEKSLKCHVDPTSIRCKVMTPKLLACGHIQNDECWKEPEDVKCDTMVTKKFSNCGHEIEVKCCQKDDSKKCLTRCNIRLDCGHQCVDLCHTEDDPDHLLYKCKKPCSKECENNHKCTKRHECYKACPPCKRQIMRTLPCGHQKELPCFEDVEAYACLEACQRTLTDCQHMCPNVCSKTCGPCQTLVEATTNCGHVQTVICGNTALKENCEEPVQPKTAPGCGHADTLVPCKIAEASAMILGQYCQKPCKDSGFTFEKVKCCGHECTGTCGQCFQGRIHTKCQLPCERLLLCGHRCKLSCSVVCRPCEEPCPIKCEHKECKRKCGEPCSPCKKKCSWSCPHFSCTMMCGEPCDREPCNHPCPNKLDCSHDCIGFCGDPCPPLCRICNKEKLEEIVKSFGMDYKNDARFIYLPDCKHTIEAGTLENYMQTVADNQSDPVEIKAIVCPSNCSIPIQNCRRFQTKNLKIMKSMESVRRQIFGTPEKDIRLRDEWIKKLGHSQISKIFPEFFLKLRKKLICEGKDQYGKSRVVPQIVDKFTMQSIDFIAKNATIAANEMHSLNSNGKLLAGLHQKTVVQSYARTFIFMLERIPLSLQEVKDFNRELDRADCLKQLMIRRLIGTCTPKHPVPHKIYLRAKSCLDSFRPLTPNRREFFVKLLKELDNHLTCDVAITVREKPLFSITYGMGQGHYFKCPLGHMYVIYGDGSTMLKDMCPACKPASRSGNHNTTESN